MKIMQINSVYGRGSTGKIMKDIHETLIINGEESIVCYGRMKTKEEKNVYKVSTEFEAKIHSVLSLLFGVDLAYSYFSTRKIIKLINKNKPDVVHLQCLNGHFVNVYKLLNYLNKNKIKTILTLHAEFMHTAGCTHAYDCVKWQSMCTKCDKLNRGYLSRFFRDDNKRSFKKMLAVTKNFEDLIVVGVSEWITNRAKKSKIFENIKKFEVVHNGINTNIFNKKSKDLFNNIFQIDFTKKNILHVTPDFYIPGKGGKILVELIEKMQDYNFIIVGKNTSCLSKYENVKCYEFIEKQEYLAYLYSVCDVFVCTSLRETYPTVCVEAVSCGGKVVGFESGGIPETIPAEMGCCVKIGDVDAMINAIKKWAYMTIDENIIKKYSSANSREAMIENYLKIYRNC